MLHVPPVNGYLQAKTAKHSEENAAESVTHNPFRLSTFFGMEKE